MNGKNYETLDFRIESRNVLSSPNPAETTVTNEFFIVINMRILWVVWVPNREPMVNIFNWLSNDLPVIVESDKESPMGTMMSITWLVPTTLAQYLYDRFRYDPQSNVNYLRKYLDLKKGE